MISIERAERSRFWQRVLPLSLGRLFNCSAGAALVGGVEGVRERGCSWEGVERELESLEERELVMDVRAAEIVVSGRILRLRLGDLRIYILGVGPKIHLVIPRLYCSCTDFSINVALRCSRGSCVHLRAVEMLERRGLGVREELLEPGEAARAVSSILGSEALPRPLV